LGGAGGLAAHAVSNAASAAIAEPEATIRGTLPT
jgi:hypothetical protein